MGMPLVVRDYRKPVGTAGRQLGSCRLRSDSGISMIEVLVTLVIVSVGLLGAAAMVINGLESNRNAYLRTQASILAYDMADRIRANGAQLASYTGFAFDSTDEEAPDLPGCFTSDAGCDGAGLANADLAQWAGALEGADGGVVLLPAAQGAIADAGGGDVTITISWIESQWDDDEEAITDQAQNFVLRFNL
jgi:type IV pilus assembly protein PilV